MTQRELARKMGRPPQAISEIVNAKKAITARTAIQLEEILGPSAEFWMGMQTTYELTLARLRMRDQTAARRRRRSAPGRTAAA